MSGLILSDKTKSLIADYLKEKPLPVIGFKSNSSMNDIAQSFFSITVGNDESIGSALESFEDLEELSFGHDALAELNQIAEKMATKINGALSEIREVGRETDSVLQCSAELFKKIAASDPVMNKFLKLETEKIEFPVMCWQKLNDYSAESSLILAVNSAANILKPDLIDLASIRFHVNQLPFVSSSKKAEYTTIKESKDFTSFLTTVKAAKATEFEQILLNEARGKQFLSEIVQFICPVHGSVASASLDITTKMLDYIQAFGMIRDTLREDVSGFGSKEYDKLQQNMQHIEAYLDLLAYVVIGQRRTLYQDAYILPNGYVNPDNEEAFVSSGLTTVQLNNCAKYYKKILQRFPGDGLSVERIKGETATVDQYINDQFASAKFDADSQTRRFQADALTNILTGKVVEARDKGIRGFNENQVFSILKNEMDLFITGAKTEYDATNDFLMSMYHPFQMSERLYKAFKEAYRTLPDSGKITNTDLKMIETKVIAKTVTEFCKKAFC